jgi:ABC-2 type transport system ATP-binding protein
LDVVLQLDAAVKDYGSKRIGPITLSVKKGQVVGLLGPNGSGKSTSIRMALGLSRPSSGVVRTMGLDPIGDHVKALNGVGYSPELPNLQTFMSPRELLTLLGTELGLRGASLRDQIPAVLGSVGLSEYSDQKIGKMSKGMVQRLSVAQSLLGTPSLLILDEPMIGIDPAGALHFRSLFRKFASEGGTIVMSSHIMSEVESLCDTLAVIHSGKLIFRGGIKEFISSSLDTRLVEVETESVSDDLVSTIQKIDGVIKVTRSQGGFTVQVEKGRDVRGDISRSVVSSGANLLSLGYSRSELDEAYLASIRGSGS